MSNRLFLGGLLALVAIVLIAMLVVLIAIYQQNNRPLASVTATAIPTETLEPTIAAKATIFVSCFNAYATDATKSSQCMETGGFTPGTSTRIP